jgi:hypothetical protein
VAHKLRCEIGGVISASVLGGAVGPPTQMKQDAMVGSERIQARGRTRMDGS